MHSYVDKSSFWRMHQNFCESSFLKASGFICKSETFNSLLWTSVSWPLMKAVLCHSHQRSFQVSLWYSAGFIFCPKLMVPYIVALSPPICKRIIWKKRNCYGITSVWLCIQGAEVWEGTQLFWIGPVLYSLLLLDCKLCNGVIPRAEKSPLFSVLLATNCSRSDLVLPCPECR